jgi:hypothetical protein
MEVEETKDDKSPVEDKPIESTYIKLQKQYIQDLALKDSLFEKKSAGEH